MKDMVIVKSKTINNESVPVVLEFIKPFTGEGEDREITRMVTFENFQATIPLTWAKTLIKSNPNEYAIVDIKEKTTNKTTERIIRVAKEKLEGFKCEFCETESKSKAGLSAHIRFNHPDKWAGKK